MMNLYTLVLAILRFVIVQSSDHIDLLFQEEHIMKGICNSLLYYYDNQWLSECQYNFKDCALSLRQGMMIIRKLVTRKVRKSMMLVVIMSAMEWARAEFSLRSRLWCR